MTASSRPENNADTLRLSRLPPQEGGTSLNPPDVMEPKSVSALPGTTDAPRSKKRQEETPKSYYDVPMLKPPVWKWEIATYFFLGGLSAGAYTLARMASRFGGKRYKDITDAGTLIAAAAFVPCAPLLIQDLGDKKRFHYMLRVFKPQSPMNLGSWVLTGYSAFITLATLNQWRLGQRDKDTQRQKTGRKLVVIGDVGAVLTAPRNPVRAALAAFRLWTAFKKRDAPASHARPAPASPVEEPVEEPADASRPLDVVVNAALDGGVPFALLLAGYTGVLLSTSATPLWARKNWLGALFSASAVSTGASAIELALQIKSPNAEARPSHAPLKTIETAAKVVEAVTLAGYLTEAGKLAAPITTGKYAPHLWGGAVGAGIVGSALLGSIPVKTPAARRALRITGAVAGLAGGLALRWAISQGGHISGKDPQAARDASKPKR